VGGVSEEVLVNITPQETRVAVVLSGAVQELLVERAASVRPAASLYHTAGLAEMTLRSRRVGSLIQSSKRHAGASPPARKRLSRLLV
jgi:Ribonuclease G/E